MEALGFIASFAMGITLGIMGGGGSIMTVPILVYLLNQPPTTATGYSLFVVGVTALIGSAMYIRRGDVDFKTWLTFAVPSIVGVNVARGIVIPAIPETLAQAGGFILTKEILIMTAFAALMILASYSMIRKRAVPQPADMNPRRRLIQIGSKGFLVGIVAGFVGAGGGFLIIPALVLMAGLTMRVAVGTSLMIIALQSLLGFAGDLARGISPDWTLLVTVAAIATAGIAAGSALAHKIKEQRLKTAFGWFVLAMGTSILLEQFRHLSF
jgi:uncharacterized membrane protein YfcA